MTETVNITMTKPGSPHMIEIVSDDDSHFCNVLKRVAKSGIAVESHLILSSDVPQWQRRYETQGFVKNNGSYDNSGKIEGTNNGSLHN